MKSEWIKAGRKPAFFYFHTVQLPNFQSMRQLVSLLLVVLVAGACQKKDDPQQPPPAPVTESMLKLNFYFMHGNSSYELTDEIFDASGRRAEFSKVRFLVSNIRVLRLDGSVARSWPGVVLKVDAAQTPAFYHQVGLLADDVTIGSLAFDVGLDDATNALEPGDFSQPPLNDVTTYQQGLGFKFLELEGRWDSDNNSAVTASDAAIGYIIGTAAMRRERILYMNSASRNLSIQVNMNGMLNGVTCSATPSATGAGAVNAQIMNNLQAAFMY
jgi:hypothetical protein